MFGMNLADKSAKRVRELEDRVENLERQHRAMLLEWESTYDKLRSIVARMAKREQREDEAAVRAPSPAKPLRLGVGDPPARRPPGPTERNY